MKRQNRRIQLSKELNIWRGFTDLISNAFMIMSFLFVLAIGHSLYFQQLFHQNQNESQQQISDLNKRAEELERKNQEFAQENNEAQQQISNLNKRHEGLERNNQELAQGNQKLNNKLKTMKGKSPPFFVIRESDFDKKGRSLRFELGSAELPEALSDYLQNKVVREIRNNRDTYKNYIIQVIGHTDTQKVVSTTSNLDVNLETIANNPNPESMRHLQAGSNADLGLMRALAVAKMLEQNLPGRKIQAYSAAQLYDADGKYTQSEPGKNEDEPARRRVEIRFTPPAEVKKL